MRSKKSQYELLFTFTISQKRYKITRATCEFLLQVYHIMGKASKHGIYTARCKPLQCRHLPALFTASGQKQADSNTFPPKVHVLSNDSQLKLCLYLSSGCKRNMLLKKSSERVHGLVTQVWTPGGGDKPDWVGREKAHLTKRDLRSLESSKCYHQASEIGIEGKQG